MYIDCNFHLYICISQYILPHNAVGRDYIIADVEDKSILFSNCSVRATSLRPG